MKESLTQPLEPVLSVVSEQGKILVAGLPVESVRDVQKYLSGGPDDVAHFEREVGLRREPEGRASGGRACRRRKKERSRMREPPHPPVGESHGKERKGLVYVRLKMMQD